MNTMTNPWPRIAAKLYLEPWCCLPEVHASICAQFRGAMAGGESLARIGGSEEKKVPKVEVHQGVALARVHGVIGKHLSGIETMCGGFDLAVFSEQMRELADDPTVRSVVVDLNTPGGVAIGVGQAAESIRRVAESGKRVIGYADYQCASAGYWLASACDEFHAEESAMVGSISTFSAGVDSSRMWEMKGLELKLFRTGELKAIGHPGKAWTAEEEEFMRTKTEAVDAMFKGFVAARRGLTAAEMNGGFWAAGCAPAGVVDSTVFGTLRELVESLI